jgi:hypothetical protein
MRRGSYLLFFHYGLPYSFISMTEILRLRAYREEAALLKNLLDALRSEQEDLSLLLVERLETALDASLLATAEEVQEALITQDRILVFLFGELEQYTRQLNDPAMDIDQLQPQRNRLLQGLFREEQLFSGLQESVSRLLVGQPS